MNPLKQGLNMNLFSIKNKNNKNSFLAISQMRPLNFLLINTGNN